MDKSVLKPAQSEKEAKRLLDALRDQIRPALELEVGRDTAIRLLAFSAQLSLRGQLAAFLSMAKSDEDIQNLLAAFPALTDYKLITCLTPSSTQAVAQEQDQAGLLRIISTATKYLIERAKEHLPNWKLVRGEHFLSYLGIHPKALEAFDHHTGAHLRQIPELTDWQKNDVDRLRQRPALIEQIKELIAGYPSAREYFISQLASELISCVSESRTNKIIFRTTDFKTHDLAHLEGANLFEVKERSPQIGNRGLGRYLQPHYQELFDWELESCRRVAGNRQVSLAILFPLVRWPEQLKQGLHRLTEMDVRPRGVGLMVETPSNVLQIDDFITLLKEQRWKSSWRFFSVIRNVRQRRTYDYHAIPMLVFGIADLTQGTLSAARDDPQMVEGIDISVPGEETPVTIKLYDEANSAVVASVKHVLIRALDQEVPCGIHTDTLESLAGRDPQFAALLATNISFLVEDHWLVDDLKRN
jgi:hypothetical protein